MNKYRGDGTRIDEPNAFDLAPKTFEPMGNLVMVQMVPVTKTPGGIHLPDESLDRDSPAMEARKAWVVSAGCQCRYVRRGDLVLVQGQCIHFKHNGYRLTCVKEDQLVGIERDEDGDVPSFEVKDWNTGEIARLP